MSHPKSNGAMWVNTEKQGSQPDIRGYIELTSEQIQRLITMGQRGMEVKLQLAGWWRQPQGGGNTYLSLSGEAYMKEEQQPGYGVQPGMPSQPPGMPPNMAPQQPQAYGGGPQVPPQAMQPGQQPNYPQQGQMAPQPQQPQPMMPPGQAPQGQPPQGQPPQGQPQQVDTFSDQDIPF